MKKIICVFSGLIFIFTSSVFAFEDYQPGPYFGGQIGWGRLDEGRGFKDASGESNLGGFTAWRVYGGYSFIPFISIEAGYTHFPDNTYSKFGKGFSNITIKEYTVDLVGKIILPLKELSVPGLLSHFSFYGKGGAAFSSNKVESSVSQKLDTIRPTYGAGVIFNFSDNIAVDASWSSVLGRNYVENANDVASGKVPVPTGHMFTLGLSYKITGIF